VNAVAPGYIETDLLHHSLREVAPDRDLLKEVKARHPLRRIGRPADVAEAVAFLASPAG